MCSYFQLLSLCFIYLSVSSASRTAATSTPFNFPLPSQDPFYIPPSGFEKLPPGQILKSRQLPHDSLTVYSSPQNVKEVHQFLYRTTDALGQPTSTVTTVMIPYNADESKLISYQMVQDSVSQDCTASYAYHASRSIKLVVAQLEMLALDSFLQRGWLVCIPDYAGPASLFASASMAGHATLDGVRSVLSSGNLTHIRSDANVQLYGYSAGALATGWSAQLQPTYAPELKDKIVAASFGGIPVRINATFAQSNNATFSALSFAAMHTFMLTDNDFAHYIDSILRPEKRNEFYKVRELCFSELAYRYSFLDLAAFFTRPDYADHPVVAKMLEANTMGLSTTPEIDLFMFHSIKDEVTPYSDVDALYKKWCDEGANIEMVQDRSSYHVVLYLTGLGSVLQTMEQRFKDPHSHIGCSKRSTSSMILNRGAATTFMKALLDAAYGLRGIPLGPKDTANGKWLFLTSSWLAPLFRGFARP